MTQDTCHPASGTHIDKLWDSCRGCYIAHGKYGSRFVVGLTTNPMRQGLRAHSRVQDNRSSYATSHRLMQDVGRVKENTQHFCAIMCGLCGTHTTYYQQ